MISYFFPQGRCVSKVALAVVSIALFVAQPFEGKAQEFRAAWADVFHVGMGSTNEVNTMVSTLVSGHYNAVIVQVLGYMDNAVGASHGAHWQSNLLPWSSRVKANFDPLAYLCQRAHDNGIEVHAWLGGSGGAMYRVSTSFPPAGNTILAAHPEWFIAPATNSEGGAPGLIDGIYCLDMGSPDAQEYIVSIVKELVTNYPIDGINWDDELNGAGYTAGFGYPAYSQASYPRSGLARYRINTGAVGTPSNTNTAWADYRRRYKNELMARVQAEMQSIKTNPRQPLRHTSAALAYSPVPTNCNFVGSTPYTYFCDWVSMLQNGWVDAVIPQTYSSSTFNTWADRSADCWQGNRNVFPGMGGYLNTNGTIVNMINYTRSKGLLGNAIYSYAVPNSTGTPSSWWAYAAANVYTNIVSTPTMPWRNPATATEGIVWGRVLDNNTGLYVDDATVTVTGGPTVKTDGNGYYIATLVPATAGGTAHLTTASKSGSTPQSTNAIALAGDIVQYDFVLNSGIADPPGITAQPTSLTNNAGTTATFFVTASGAETLSYQWRKGGSPLTDGGNISGATSATLTLTTVLAADAASYTVFITNNFGSITSSNATLTVIDPVINTQPVSRTNNVGSTATFSVVATGTATLSYQWRKNGSNLSNIGNVSGATSATLTLSSVTALDAAGYTVKISNSSGNVTSVVATLTVNTAPSISSQPSSRTNVAGTIATFSVTSDGAPPLSYQWKKGSVSMSNSGNVSGATSTTLTLSNVSQADASNYSVVVSNTSGSVTSSPALLVVIDPPGIVTQPQSLTNQAGTSATFSVVANGTAPLNYQWRFNGNNLSGATDTSYTRNSALTNHVGDYTVIVTNAAGAVTSSIATLTVTGEVQTVTLTNIWNIQAGSRPYVTTGNTERGLALNPVSNHALIVSRASAVGGLSIYVLDSETGAELGTMSVAGVNNNAIFKLNKIGVADDGVIYAANLTTASSTSPLVIYRWSDESSTPTIAYSGAPDGGNTPRWGDSFDVRGTGTNTQIIISGSSTTTNLVLFTTADGLNFAVTTLNPSPAFSAGAFARGLSFGAGDTFFSKHDTNTPESALQFSFSPSTSTATLIANIPTLDTSMVAIGIDLGNNLLAGVLDDNTTNTASHQLKVYNIANPSAPAAVSNFYFLPMASGVSSGNLNYAGHVDTDGTRIIGLDTQNGIVALKIVYASTPVIETQPQSRTNIAGTTATFTVAADGVQPLDYQWKKGGVNLSDGGNVSGATTATLTLDNVNASDAANYTVSVSNSGGSVNSAVATLTVIDPPSITSEPTSQTNNAGSSATFSVTVTGSEPLVFQWKKGASNLSDGGNISGATTASLTLSSISQADAAGYSVVVTNSGGSDTSLTATLTVNDPPAIATQPASQTIGAGSNAVFAVSATGGNLSYSWSKNSSPLANGGNVSGATSASLTLSAVSSSDAANYTVAIANSAGSITSAPPAVLTVINPPVITASPASRTNDAATTATFSVSATGTAPLLYQWRRGGFDLNDGGNVSGANSATLTLIDVSTADAADYDVLVSNGAGSVTSATATFTVIDPAITSQPSGTTNNAGTTATFNIVANGTGLTYQWRKDEEELADGGKISGATSPTLTITNLLAVDAGAYSVLVSGDGGNATSSNAILTVVDPIITAHPANQNTNQGSVVNFSVAAYGTDPLFYQWRRNSSPLADGGNISGATTAILTLSSVSLSDNADYSVSVSNLSGSVTSSNASLTVLVNDPYKPTLAFTIPSKTHDGIMKLTGTTKDTAPGVVTEVWYRLLPATDFSPAILSGSGSKLNWESPDVELTPGTNVVYAYAIDSSGNHSATTNSKTFFYDTTNSLTVNIIGGGEVKTSSGAAVTNGQKIPLLVGRPSSLTAFIRPLTPATNYVFSNWFGTITTNNPNLSFIMQSNMVLTAQFITNPFVPVAGKYNGLFFATNGIVTHGTAGFITFNVSSKASYSGKILLDGNVVGISGKFDLSGRAVKTFSRAVKFGKSDLNLDLSLDWSTSSQKAFGTIGDGTWSSEIEADRATFNSTNPATNFVGRYTMLIPRTNYPAASPGGFGYGLITNKLVGQIVLSGKTGDGVLLSQSVPISKDGHWPLYVPLYKNTNYFANGITLNKADYRGSLLGWVSFTSPNDAPTGNLSWIKTAVPSSDAFNVNYFYPAGFTNLLDLIASPFHTPGAGTRLLQFTNATLMALHGNLTGPIAWNAVVSSNNAVSVSYSGTDKVTLTLNAKTGLLKGTFPHSNNGNLITTFWGAILQDQNYAAGEFTGRTDLDSSTNQTGSVFFSGN